jgi:hypothetical protein
VSGPANRSGTPAVRNPSESNGMAGPRGAGTGAAAESLHIAIRQGIDEAALHPNMWD